MAAPQTVGTVATDSGTGSTNQVANIPGSIVSGELVLIAIGTDGDRSITFDTAGWTEIDTDTNTCTLSIWGRIADGTEGSTVQFDISASEDWVSVAWRVENHGVSTLPTDLTIPTAATGTNPGPNPPNCNPAADEHLYAGFMACDRRTITIDPANATHGVQRVQSSGSQGASVGSAMYRATTETSYDIGPWTISSSDGWVANTIGIPPASGDASVDLTAIAATISIPTASPVTTDVAMNALYENSGDTSGGTSKVSDGISPTSNALVLAAVASSHATETPSAPTIAGCNLTWAQARTFLFDTSGTQRRVTLFRGMGSSPTTDTVDFDWGSQTQQEVQMTIVEFTGVDTSGSAGSGAYGNDAQSPAADTAGTSLDVTLSFGTGNNATYGVLVLEAGTSNDPTVDFIEIHDVYGGSGQRLNSQYWLSETSPVGWSWPTSTKHGAFAVEIVAAAGDVNVDLTAIAATVTMPDVTESGKAAVTTTALTPTTELPTAVASSPVSVTLTAIAATVSMDAAAASGVAAVTTTALVTTVSMDAAVASGIANVTLTALTPAVFMPTAVAVGVAEVSLTAILATASLDTPIVSTDVSLTTTALQLLTELPTAVAGVTANVTLTPLALTTEMTGSAQSGIANVSLTAIVMTVSMDAATASGAAAVTSTGFVTEAFVPTPTVSGQAARAPPAIAAVAFLPTASLSTEVSVVLTAIAVTVELPTVTVDAGGSANVDLTAIAASVSMDAASVDAEANVTLTAITATTTMDAATAAAAAGISLTAIVTPVTLDAATVTTEASIVPASLFVETFMPTVNVEAGGTVNVNLTAFPVTTAIDQPTLSTDVALTTTAVTATTSMDQAAVSGAANVTLTAIAASVSLPTGAVAGIAEVTLSALTVDAFLPTVSVETGGGGVTVPLTAIAVQVVAISGSPVTGGSQAWVYLTSLRVGFEWWSWKFHRQFGGGILVTPIVETGTYVGFTATGIGVGDGSGTLSLTAGDMTATGIGVGTGRVITDTSIVFVNPLDSEEIDVSPYNVVVRAFDWVPTVAVFFVVNDDLPWFIMGAYWAPGPGEVRWNYLWDANSYVGSIDLDTHMAYGAVSTSLDRAGVQPISGIALDTWTDSITVTKQYNNMIATGIGVGSGYAAMFDTQELGFASGVGVGLGVGAMFDERNMVAVGVGVGTGVMYVRFDYQRGVGVGTTRPPSVSSDTAVPSVSGEAPPSVDADAEQTRVEVDDG